MTDLARTPKQLGNIFRRRRRKLGLTQAQLGEKAGLRQATISLVESGDEGVKLSTLLSILAALDLEFRIVQRSKSSDRDIEDIF